MRCWSGMRDGWHRWSIGVQCSLDCVVLLFFQRPSLSRGLFAVSFRRVVHLLRIHPREVTGSSHNFKLSFNSLFLFWRRPKAHHKNSKSILQVRVSSTLDIEWFWFNISQFWNRATRFFAEPGGFSSLPHIFNDWFGMVSSSQLVHLFLNFGHPFLIFNNCILWNSFNAEINFKFMLFFRNR